VEEELSPAERFAQRAAELAARAQALADSARDAEEVDAELRQLEEELAALDAEQERLEHELTGDDVPSATPPRDGGPHDEDGDGDRERDGYGFAFKLGNLGNLGNLGDRISDIVNTALSSVGRWGAVDVVERTIELTDGSPLPLSVDAFAGSISIVTGEYGRIHLVAERHALEESDLDLITINTSKEDDGVHVVAATDTVRRNRLWVQLTLTVPPGTPTRLHTRGGSVRVDGTAAAVNAHTSGGSIRLTGTSGPAELETAGGSIRADNHGGPVRAETAGGSIRLQGGLEAVDARTLGGSIRVDGAYGPVAAITKGGTVEVSGRLAGSCILETAGGSIRVTLDPGSNLEVDLQGGGVSSDFELDGGKNHKHGVVGDASEGKLVARTVGGSVALRRG
jgi:hypothetical protein